MQKICEEGLVLMLWSLPDSVVRFIQKQPSRGALKKRCFENMQQIYRRTHMPKHCFNNVALQLYWNRTSARAFSCKFAAPFLKNTSVRMLLFIVDSNGKKRGYERQLCEHLCLSIFLMFSTNPKTKTILLLCWYA